MAESEKKANNLFFTPYESLYAGFGAYYANRSVTFGIIEGSPEDAQPTASGSFLIGEGGLKWRRAGDFAGNIQTLLWEPFVWKWSSNPLRRKVSGNNGGAAAIYL